MTIPKTMEAAVVERFAEPLEDEMDLEEALTFAAEGKVKATIETQPLESINDVFARLKNGKVNRRIVSDIAEHASLGGFKKSVAAA